MITDWPFRLNKAFYLFNTILDHSGAESLLTDNVLARMSRTNGSSGKGNSVLPIGSFRMEIRVPFTARFTSPATDQRLSTFTVM